MSCKVTLLITTFRRANLLKWGLFSLAGQEVPFEFETIVINDGLNDETEEICRQYRKKLNLKYIFSGHRNLGGEMKWRVPGFAFNIGARHSSGKVLILTCAEMFHLNDTVSRLAVPVLENPSLLAVPIGKHDRDAVFLNYLNEHGGSYEMDLFNKCPDLDIKLPYLLAVSRAQFFDIGGYDEDFTGVAAEDNDLVDRLQLNGCTYYQTGAKTVHLYHPRHLGGTEHHPEVQYNRNIYYARKGITVRNADREWGRLDTWRLRKIPKTAHFYWGNDTLSFLRYIAVYSFRKLNPDWKIKLHYPRVKYLGDKTWATRERYGRFRGKNYLEELLALDIEKAEVDFGELGFNTQVPENYKADFLRWHILSTEGGLWSDIDIIYFKPMVKLYFNTEAHKDTDTVVCINEHRNNSVGFMLTAPGNELCGYVHRQSFANLNLKDYQSMGPIILDNSFPSVDSIEEAFPSLNVHNIKMEVVYPVHDNPPRDRWAASMYHSDDMSAIAGDTIGLHWYAGHPDAGEWENKLTESNFHKFNNTLTRVIGKVFGKESRKYSIVCTCKVYNELRKGNLERFVKYVKPLVDALVVYDDGSTDGSYEFLLRHTPYVIRGSKNDFVHERVHRQLLLTEALKLSPDFILWLDADEVLTANAAQKLQDLCAYCVEHQVDALKFHELNIWRSQTWRRLDSLFDVGWFTRLWRVTPGMTYDNADRPGLHQSQIPSTIRVIEQTHEVKVLHYGFSSEKNLAYKYFIYRSHGQRGYEMLDRLLSEEQLEIERIPREMLPEGLWADEGPPRPMPFVQSLAYAEEYREEVFGPKFSIICPVYKSIGWLKFVYEQVLKYTDMSDKEFFFVAADAHQAVTDYLKDNYVPYYVMESAPEQKTKWYINTVYRAYNFGAARARGDFLVFLHSDMALSPGWFDNLIKAYSGSDCITPRLVESGKMPSGQYGISKDFGQTAESFREPEFVRYAAEKGSDRIENGGMYFPLLIRKEHFDMVGGYPEGNVVPESDIYRPRIAVRGEPCIVGYEALRRKLSGYGINQRTAFDSIVYHFQSGESSAPEPHATVPGRVKVALCNAPVPGPLPVSVSINISAAGSPGEYAAQMRDFINRYFPDIEIIVQDASSVDIVNEARYTIVFLKDDQRDEGPFSSIRENNLKRARKLVADSVSVALAYPEYDFEIIPEKVPPGSGTDYWHKLLTGVFREITVQNIRCSG